MAGLAVVVEHLETKQPEPLELAIHLQLPPHKAQMEAQEAERLTPAAVVVVEHPQQAATELQASAVMAAMEPHLQFLEAA